VPAFTDHFFKEKRKKKTYKYTYNFLICIILKKILNSKKMYFKGQESQSGDADGTKVNGDTVETKTSENRTISSGPRWSSANDLYDICSE